MPCDGQRGVEPAQLSHRTLTWLQDAVQITDIITAFGGNTGHGHNKTDPAGGGPSHGPQWQHSPDRDLNWQPKPLASGCSSRLSPVLPLFIA
ncbi:hypothetical protein STEG23_034075 [Scotinomys teguina]